MSALRPCRSNASRMGCKRSLEILYVRIVNRCRSSVLGAVAFGVAAHRPVNIAWSAVHIGHLAYRIITKSADSTRLARKSVTNPNESKTRGPTFRHAGAAL